MTDAAAKLRAMEDAEEVRMLCIDYGRTLDGKDFVGYASLFAETGIWDGVGGLGPIEGREIIESFMTETFGGPNAVPCVHLMTNFDISVSGDTATAWSRWTLIEDRGHGPQLIYCGHYDDELVRTGQGWRFARRTVTVDIE